MAQKYLLIGMGKTNRSLAKLLKSGAIKDGVEEVMAVDDVMTDELRNFCNDLDISLFEGDTSKASYKMLIDGATVIIPTPGISDSHQIFKLASSKKFYSELDIAFSATQLSSASIVAVTGTNGKTTVVELVRDALVTEGIKAVSCGNNEMPFSQAVLEEPEADVFVVEASSFALRFVKEFAPNISTWLNFSPNHLNKHKNLKSYEKSKANIWKHISEKDFWVANSMDSVVLKNRPKKGSGSYFVEGDSIEDKNKSAVFEIASLAGASQESIQSTFQNFNELPHRMELVASIDGVEWINDSKATTPAAVLAGVSKMEKVVLIAGGKNHTKRILDIHQLDNVVALVAIGECGSELVKSFSSPTVVAKDMKEAVLAARDFAQKQNARSVILSPGASSHDWYESYIQRGDEFKAEVRGLFQ